jgi:putative transposase
VRNHTIAGRAGKVFHVVSRAIEGQLLFRNFGDYLAFKRLVARAVEVSRIRVLAYCFMPNHWHFILWPRSDDEVTRFVRWLAATHARALRRWRGSEGRGAVYQSRYRASALDTERYFYIAMRYVERNALRAGLVDKAEDWPWSSASGAALVPGLPLASWPLPRPRNWRAFVNAMEAPADVEFIRRRTERNEPIAREDEEVALTLPADDAETEK